MYTNYKRGRKREYKVCKQLREDGYTIVQRTAGSHSPIDVIAIDRDNKIITLVQVKHNNYDPKHILKELDWLNGTWTVELEIR